MRRLADWQQEGRETAAMCEAEEEGDLSRSRVAPNHSNQYNTIHNNPLTFPISNNPAPYHLTYISCHPRPAFQTCNRPALRNRVNAQ